MVATTSKSPTRTDALPIGDEVLVRLLAERDAVFAPVRRFAGNLNAAAWLARRDFPSEGIAWHSEGKSDRRRKDLQLTLEHLAADGMLTTVRNVRRTTGVKLTGAGEYRAASLACQFTLADGISVFQAIQRRAAAGITEAPEDDLRGLASVKAWNLERKPSLVLIGDMLLPFIVRGMIDAGSTIHGNVRYLPGLVPAPADFGEPADASLGSGAGRRIYVDSFDRERARLAIVEVGQEIGPVPLSMSATSEKQLDGWRRSAEMATHGE